MTDLFELARDPKAFDTRLAELQAKRDQAGRDVQRHEDAAHRLLGDKKSYRNTRVPVWAMTSVEVEHELQRRVVDGDVIAGDLLRKLAAEHAIVDAFDYEIGNMNNVYLRSGNRWTRFFPSQTKSQPHIHRSLTCHTLYPTTVMSWAPELSGKTDAEAVEQLDEALCSVCFPDAPVALHEYVSRKSQAERDARAAEKQARDDARAAKMVEPFRTSRGDRVETVAACKQVIRDMVEYQVEVEYAKTERAAESWGDNVDGLENYRRNLAHRLERLVSDATIAEDRLRAKGMAQEEIDQLIARKDKTARKQRGI